MDSVGRYGVAGLAALGVGFVGMLAQLLLADNPTARAIFLLAAPAVVGVACAVIGSMLQAHLVTLFGGLVGLEFAWLALSLNAMGPDADDFQASLTRFFAAMFGVLYLIAYGLSAVALRWVAAGETAD